MQGINIGVFFIQLNGYIELQQFGVKGVPVRVATAGDKGLKGDDAERVLKIGDSRWQVAYWPSVNAMVYLGSLSIWTLGAFLSAATAIIALIMVLFSRLNGALQLDQASIATLIKDYRDGRVRREYPVGLVEMRQSIEFMTQLAGGGVTHQAGIVAPREQDAESATQAGHSEEEAPIVPNMKEGVAAVYDSAVSDENMIVEEDPLDIKAEEKQEISIDASIFRAYDIRVL